MKLLSIDPGSTESAYCIINTDTYTPEIFGKVKNEELLEILHNSKLHEYNKFDEIVIEMIACYGMAVGEEVFQTWLWIGKFAEASGLKENYIYRKVEKMYLCHTMRAKDSNIRQALIDRFGEVGTKKNQGWFYGFKSDIWASYAVGITYIDKIKGRLEII